MFLSEYVPQMSQFDYLDRGEQALLGLGRMGDPTISAAAEELIHFLSNSGYTRLSNVVPEMTPGVAEYLLQLSKSGQLPKVVQLVGNYATNVAKLNKFVGNIVAQTAAPAATQAGPLMKFLGSAEFATVGGLLSIAWDSAQIAKASAAATDAMDEAQRTGRLTRGAVQKAFNALPPDLQHSVQSIKDAQNLISGYTKMRYDTQKLIAKTSDPQMKAAYQDLANRADAKINGLSALLDTMRQTGYKGFPKAPTKTTGSSSQSDALNQAYQQWLAQTNKRDSAQQQALFSQIASTIKQQQAGAASGNVSTCPPGTFPGHTGQCMTSAQDLAAYTALLNQGLIENTSGGATGATEAQNFPGIPDYGAPPVDVSSSSEPDAPAACVCGVSCYCDAEHPQCCDIHDPVQHSIIKRSRRHVRGLGEDSGGGLGLAVMGVLVVVGGLAFLDSVTKKR